MAAKLVPKGSCFPTELKSGGHLIIHVGDYEIKREYPFVEGEYPYDTTSYGNNNIAALVTSLDRTAIFRFDGTYSLLMGDNTLIGFRRGMNFNFRDDIQILRRCSIIEDDTLYEVWIYVIKATNQIIFDTVCDIGFLVLNASNPSCQQLIKDISEDSTYFYPQFVKNNGTYQRLKDGELTYSLDGQFYRPSKVLSIV